MVRTRLEVGYTDGQRVTSSQRRHVRMVTVDHQLNRSPGLTVQQRRTLGNLVKL